MLFNSSLSLLAVFATLTTLNPAALAYNGNNGIVGGDSVAVNDPIARQTVGLFFESNTGGSGICSGSILRAGVILTAAHCIENAKAGAVVFSNDNLIPLVQTFGTPQASSQVYPMTNVKAFPGFPGESAADGSTATFEDLALVTYNGPIPQGFQAAQFLSLSQFENSVKSGAPVELAGYGVINNDRADTSLRGAGTLRKVQVKFMSKSNDNFDIFVGGRAGHITCSGDSGGPAMVTLGGQIYVVGVLSRGDCVSNSIYTLVTSDILANSPL